MEKTWSNVIDDYLASSPNGFGRTKSANLDYLKRLDFGSAVPEGTEQRDLVELANDLIAGVKAPSKKPEEDGPEHFELSPRSPATVSSYFATLGTVIGYGGPLTGLNLPEAEFERALRSLRHGGIVGKPKKRTRRPTLDELDRLLAHFRCRFMADRRRVPMNKVIAGAILLSHRQAALCACKRKDFDETARRLWLRNLKHPREAEGNDVELWVIEEACRLIMSMPRVSDRIFPYTLDVVCRLFTEACQLLGIEDIHFHDLRHEAISRFFEIELEGGSRDMIMKYTGHSPDGSLSRYINIRQSGDKYADWPGTSASSTHCKMISAHIPFLGLR